MRCDRECIGAVRALEQRQTELPPEAARFRPVIPFPPQVVEQLQHLRSRLSEPRHLCVMRDLPDHPIRLSPEVVPPAPPEGRQAQHLLLGIAGFQGGGQALVPIVDLRRLGARDRGACHGKQHSQERGLAHEPRFHICLFLRLLLLAGLGGAHFLRTTPTGTVSAACIAASAKACGRFKYSSAMSTASWPPKTSSPITSVGTPKMPREIAQSVFARSRSFTAGSAMAACGFVTPSRGARSAMTAGSLTSRPSRNTASSTVPAARRSPPAAMMRRNAESGLNGWAGGMRIGIPMLRARHMTKR